MVPASVRRSHPPQRGEPSYSDLKMTVAIVAGADERLIARKLSRRGLTQTFRRIALTGQAKDGHLVHQKGTTAVMAVINEASQTAGLVRNLHAP